MKKLIVIIIILIIILAGMIVYKKNTSVNSNDSIDVQEISKIETYITKIYMWKEITGEALPCFDEINQADEMWIWEVVNKNLEDYEFSYSQIQEKAKELFGESFTKKFPKEGTKNLIYDETSEKYYAVGIGLDQEEDVFLLNEINKIENGYEIEIIEYLEDYSQMSAKDDIIIIKSTNGEEIGRISSTEEEQSKELVKNNTDSVNKKKVVLKEDNEKLYVEKVYNL